MKKKTTKQFIEESKEVHGDKYNYSLVDYINTTIKIKIICKEHGVFDQHPNTHKMGGGCPACKGLKRNTIFDFIKKSNIIHKDKYDYSLVKFKDIYTGVKIICPIHGIFEQKPKIHLSKKGCKSCGIESKKKNINNFINESNTIHNNKYDYLLVKYKNIKTKIKIICPIHGIFEQIPDNHTKGHGCPICKESKGEIKIRNILEDNNIKFDSQKMFDGCQNIKPLSFDFYLLDYNTCIEFDGRQHYKSIEFFGGEKRLLEQQKRDKIKTNFCKNNKINLIRIKYNENINDKLQFLL